MKITVLNGSPKGKYSVTLQYAKYLEINFPEAEFTYFNIGQTINKIEKDEAIYRNILETIGKSDCVLWVYPVYTFLVPYQLVHFISLIYDRGDTKYFNGKYSAQILTSMHFYDHTAYNYIHEVSEDFGMMHIHGYSGEMEDLKKKKERVRLQQFGQDLIYRISNKITSAKKYSPVINKPRVYSPVIEKTKTEKSEDYKIVLVTDCKEENSNLWKMIQIYQNQLTNKLSIVNIKDFEFKGGCLGCFNCSYDGTCIYNDHFDDFHRTIVQGADCVIFAADIHHHWFSSVWKCYDDRQFYNGHRISMMGKSQGYLISGPLKQEANLREVLEARSEVSGMYLIDIVTDEVSNDQELTDLIKAMADSTMTAVITKPQRPANFLGVGGMKIFRDLIYVMRGLMKEDHRFYKKNGIYDFPQKKVGRIILMKIVGFMMNSKTLRKKSAGFMKEGMISSFEKHIKKE